MKLKKVPKGTRVIKFTNILDKECNIFLDKKIFETIPKKSFLLIGADDFFCGKPMKEFPEWQFYSNSKIVVEFL